MSKAPERLSLDDLLDDRDTGPRVPEAVVLPPPDESGNDAWMITFTDLVALLLTFFVMLFAMSQVEERKWENLTQILAENLQEVKEKEEVEPIEEISIEPVAPIPGDDLDYLASILDQHRAESGSLGGAIMTQQEDRLVLSLPGDLLFSPSNSGLSKEASDSIFALGGVLMHLGNRIEVVGHADPDAPGKEAASNWELSLARGASVASLLRRSGVDRPIGVRGQGDGRFEEIDERLPDLQRKSLARRVDIVIFSEIAGEGS